MQWSRQAPSLLPLRTIGRSPRCRSTDTRLAMRLQQSAGGGRRSRASSAPLVCRSDSRSPLGLAIRRCGLRRSARWRTRAQWPPSGDWLRRLSVEDSVGCGCAGRGGLAARAFQRAAAFGAGRASAGAVGAAGDAGLPFPPAVAAPPPCWTGWRFVGLPWEATGRCHLCD